MWTLRRANTVAVDKAITTIPYQKIIILIVAIGWQSSQYTEDYIGALDSTKYSCGDGPRKDFTNSTIHSLLGGGIIR